MQVIFYKNNNPLFLETSTQSVSKLSDQRSDQGRAAVWQREAAYFP